MKRFLLFFLCWSSPLGAQTVDTTSGYIGDTLRLPFTLDSGCRRYVRLSPTGAYQQRHVGCGTVRLLVPPPPPPASGTVVFRADWSTALGNTQAALRDLNKTLPFDYCGGSAEVAVVPTAGLGFPVALANALRITRNNQDSWFGCRIGTDANGVPGNVHWPQLAPGQANYWRVYLRVDIPNSEGNILSSSGLSHHPIQMAANTGNFEPTNFFSRADGTYAIEMYTFAQQNPFPQDKAVLGQFTTPDDYGQRLPKFTTLRYEWMVRRELTTGYSIAFRIYNDANQLLWSEDGIGALRGAVMTERGSGQVTLKSLDGKYNADLATLQSLQIGENGGWHSYSQNVYFYWGALAMCTSWCGPYVGTN